ncbi:bacterioferritin-associated ferredoxin [Methylocella sp.]|uniref:bacterioferritin-associated ferredoxin n=1 Tax=Methylocella sp. TaxID=1978226 RepID=UPI003785204D
MIVCSCNVLSDAKIKSAIDAGDAINLRTPSAVYKCLGCSPNCGRCFKTVRKIIDDAMRAHVDSRASLDAHAHAGGCDPACAGKCHAETLAPELPPAALFAGAGDAAPACRPD